MLPTVTQIILHRNSHHERAIHNEVSGMPVGGIGTEEASDIEIVENRVHDKSFWGPEQGSVPIRSTSASISASP